MAKDTNSPQRPRYWLLTSPRTASNLLVKMLNLDEQNVRPASHGGYFFLQSLPKHFLLAEKPIDKWTEEESATVNKVIQECSERFQDYIAAAGRTVGSQKEAVPLPMMGINQPTRSPLNLTLFPDEFLKTWNPTFLIRHPALMIPSLYRTCFGKMEWEGFKRPRKEPMTAEVTTKWHRTLYDFFSEHFANDSIWPIVIDADDVMTCPQLVGKYAQLTGLDETKVRYSWDKAGDEELNKLSHVEKRMLSSINASTTIDQSKVAGKVDIDQEVVKWKTEFGEEGAQKLERWVRDAMPDYEFLHSRRLRLEQE
ncbi:hypothetical protein FGADI_1234 [Fusarium gaditjirri]|uniref:P-loop containing nucleoside triphosphate hydrolase protein n=1 Tax=Fusarium gaditjirri TaxID=282569 RepID=A0A8H4X412_9HYPO|nr:hypothetical protein FGADI_1234 [Fusarium gaditjirri]